MTAWQEVAIKAFKGLMRQFVIHTSGLTCMKMSGNMSKHAKSASNQKESSVPNRLLFSHRQLMMCSADGTWTS